MKNLYTFWQEVKVRWSSEEPVFFKKLLKVGATAGGLGIGIQVGIQSAQQLAPSYQAPDTIVGIANHMITAGIAIAAISKLTQKSNDTPAKNS